MAQPPVGVVAGVGVLPVATEVVGAVSGIESRCPPPPTSVAVAGVMVTGSPACVPVFGLYEVIVAPSTLTAQTKLAVLATALAGIGGCLFGTSWSSTNAHPSGS